MKRLWISAALAAAAIVCVRPAPAAAASPAGAAPAAAIQEQIAPYLRPQRLVGHRPHDGRSRDGPEGGWHRRPDIDLDKQIMAKYRPASERFYLHKMPRQLSPLHSSATPSETAGHHSFQH